MPAVVGTSRQRIHDAVTELFVRRGFHGTSIRDISDAVNLGRGALYHHIGSKEGLLFEISMNLLDGALGTARPVAESALAPRDKLHEMARALLRHHAEHGDGWTVAVHEARFLSAERRAEVVAARDAFEDLWRTVLDEGARATAWRDVTDIDVRGILGALNSAARWYRPEGKLSPEEIADHYVGLFVDGLHT